MRSLINGIVAALILATASPLFAAADGLKVQAVIQREGGLMGFGLGSLWFMSGSKLVRIDPTTNTSSATLIRNFVGHSRGIAVGEGAVWISDVGTKTIFKFDPATNQVVRTFQAEISDHEGSVGVGFGSVWITTNEKPKPPLKEEGKRLSRFDAVTGDLQAVIDLPVGSKGVAVGEKSVWVTGTSGDELYRIDPASNSLKDRIKLQGRPRFLATDATSVWVVNQSDGTVQRVDQTSDQVLATIGTGAAGPHGDITVGGGFVWLTRPDYPLYKIDPKNNKLEKRYERPAGTSMGNAIRYGAGSLWLSGPEIYRVEPP